MEESSMRTPRHTAILDDADCKALRDAAIKNGVHAKLTDKTPEGLAIRKRRKKLLVINRLENQACGEEGW